jgi:Domain of unknown function (DUF4145)
MRRLSTAPTRAPRLSRAASILNTLGRALVSRTQNASQREKIVSEKPSDSANDFHEAVVDSRREAIARNAKTENSLPPDTFIYCNQCKGETHHICKADYSREYLSGVSKYLGGFWELIGYRLWMCAGCESCTLERYYTNELMENGTIDYGEQYYETKYYPERTEFHAEGKRFLQLPQKLDSIYRETLHAFNNNLSVLCAAGLRTLIEGICEDKQVKGRNLQDKINALDGVLPQNIVTNLHGFRFIGNTALHELTAPSQEDLRLAIEICEDLLNYLYELDYKTRRLVTSRRGAQSNGEESVS